MKFQILRNDDTPIQNIIPSKKTQRTKPNDKHTKINQEKEQDITLQKLMRTKDVLEYFNIHRSTLYSWTKVETKPIKIQHSKFYKLKEKSLVG